MKIRLESIVVAIFMVGSVSLFAFFNINKPHILILQSYDKGYSWVKDTNIGLKRVLDKHRDYSVRWYYMDTKRHPFPEFKINAGKTAQRMIKQTRPDVIIALDDDAQQFVMRNFVNDPNVKIVFSGVNNTPAAYGYDNASNVTGVLERIPLNALKETLQIAARNQNLKSPVRIQFIGDRAETVLLDHDYASKHDWAPLRMLKPKALVTYDEWKQAVLESEGKTDFLITSNYRKIVRSASDSTLVLPSELMAWTERHSPVPVIGVNGFVAEDGGMLAIGTSGYEQGEAAAKLAVEIIDHGIAPNKLPFVISHQFVVAMRETAINKRHFDLPKVYEAAARAGGKYYK